MGPTKHMNSANNTAAPFGGANGILGGPPVFKKKNKQKMYDDSTMSKIGVYAAANVRSNYFVNSNNQHKKFMQMRRNSQASPKHNNLVGAGLNPNRQNISVISD